MPTMKERKRCWKCGRRLTVNKMIPDYGIRHIHYLCSECKGVKGVHDLQEMDTNNRTESEIDESIESLLAKVGHLL